MSFQSRIIGQRGQDPVYLLRSSEGDALARWFYVQVTRLREPVLLKALSETPCDCAALGVVLASGYGSEPPAHIAWELKEKGLI